MGSGGLQQILQQFQGQGGNQLGNLGNIPRSMPSGGNFGAGGPQMPGGSTIPQEPMQGPQWGNMPNSGGIGLSPTSGGPQGVRGPGSPSDSFPGQMQPKTPMQPGNSKGGPSMSASILPGMQQMQPTQAQAGSAMAAPAPMKSPWGANSLRGPGGF